MKIAFTTCFRESYGGGMGFVAYEIARAFAKQGHDTVLVCPGNKTQIVKVAPHLRFCQVRSMGEGNLAIPYLTVKNIQFLFDFFLKFKPQIIHAHDFGPITLACQFWALNNKTIFFYTAHVLPTKALDFAINEFSKGFGRLLDTAILKKYFTNFFKNCDAMIALNEEAEKDIRAYGYKNRTFAIPNGRDLQLYYRCHSASLKAETIQLTFTGYLTVRKNQKYLIQVMEYLPKNYLLNLVGVPLNPSYLTMLKKYAHNKKLTNINFMGQIPYEEIPKLLEKTHVFVSASKMEVQSLSVIEALAAGLPLVGLANETISELVDNKNGLCLPKKTSAKVFAQKVKEICSLDQKKYEDLGREARRRISHLDWPLIVKRTEKVYWEMIKEKVAVAESKQVKRFQMVKELITLLPASKIKNFLKKQIKNPKLKIKRKKNLFFLIFTVVGTVSAGSLFWLFRQSKRILLLKKQS